jgi:DNA-binding transcriptional LysR family regulator
MDELSALRTFARVAAVGSFSSAARALGTTTSSISRQVAGLEESLGVRLFNRTTRQLVLTEAGRQYFDDVSPLIKQLDEARDSAAAFQEGVKGRLHLHASNLAGAEIIVPALPQFLAKYPELLVEVTLTGERVDLLAERVDVAVWVGSLGDSSLVARQLSPSRWVLCGSAAYFARHPAPRTPAELARHNCLLFTRARYLDEWTFRSGSEVLRVPVAGNLRTNTTSVLMTSVKKGLGLAVLQEWMVRQACREGTLQAVLTDYEINPTADDTALYIVYPQRRLPPKTRALVEFIAGLFEREGVVR